MTEEEFHFGNMTECQSRNVLKTALHEYNYHNVVHQDPLTELIIVKHILRESDVYNAHVVGYVQSISLDPLCINMFTEQQLLLAKEHFKKGNGVLYLDATGSVIQSIPGNKSRIFYYTMVVKGEPGEPPLPMFEWISNVHNVPHITAALLDYKYDLNKIGCKKNPSRIEIDFSWALIHSTLTVYNQESIGKYLERVYDIVVYKKGISSCTFIHICAAHMIKAVRNSICKVTKDKNLVEIVTRCFAGLQISKDMATAIGMWKLMLKVFMPVKKDHASVAKLKSVLGGFQEELDIEEGDLTPEDTEFDIASVPSIRRNSPFNEFFMRHLDTYIDGDSTEELPDSTNNNYRAIQAMELLAKEYLPLFPLWSGVVFTLAGESITRDTNSPVENWFRILKHDVLGGKTKMRIGKFVISLNRSLMGRIRIRQLGQEKVKTKGKNTEEMMGAKEEWDRKRKKEKTKKTYYEGRTEIPSPTKKNQEKPGPKLKKDRRKPDDNTMRENKDEKNRTEAKEGENNKKDTGKSDQRGQYPLHGIRNNNMTCWLISSLQSIAHLKLEIECKYH